MARIRKLSLQLPCSFSDAELNEKRDHLAAVIIGIGEVQDRKKAVAGQFKEELDGLYSESGKLARQIRARVEDRLIECKVLYDKPGIGEKTIVRLDTGEQVRIEPMTTEEMQEEIEFTDEEQRQVKDLLDSVNPPDAPPESDQPPSAA